MKMNFNRPLILASKSPRRIQLLKEAGFNFEVISQDVDESFPDSLHPKDVAAYLSRKKADGFTQPLNDAVLITADTTVVQGLTILNKAKNKEEAYDMLYRLSNNKHEVITGYTIKDRNRQITKSSVTKVHFHPLSDEEIYHYIETFKPFDKAGAYGIQEWIGMIGISKIEGSYYNVVGLPVDEIYRELVFFS